MGACNSSQADAPLAVRSKADAPLTGRKNGWNIECGEQAAGIRNPIREIMDTIAGKENKNLKVLSLAQGDPSAFPHLAPPDVMINTVVGTFQGAQSNGYQPSQGNTLCRKAIAEHFSVPKRKALTANDIFMTIGCSEALNHCVSCLAKRDANILLPRPGFPLYDVLCWYHNVEPRYYDLDPAKGWECDLEGAKEQVDANTVAILVNNPSNPCGAVYSRNHLEAVMKFAESQHLIVIADEVYFGMSFTEEFVTCAEAGPQVPVMSVCALSKRWLAPGWRVGWVTCYDADNVMENAGVHETLLKLCQVSLGPSAPIQVSIPAILSDTPKEWYTNILSALRESAEYCVKRCKEIEGLEVASDPQGAMYFMVRIVQGALRDVDDDIQFAQALLSEQSVVVLPGQCFSYPGYWRCVFAAPVKPTLTEAWDRIAVFCKDRLIPVEQRKAPIAPTLLVRRGTAPKGAKPKNTNMRRTVTVVKY